MGYLIKNYSKDYIDLLKGLPNETPKGLCVINANAMEFIRLNVHIGLVMNAYLIFSLISLRP
jgi:hypothetical protein